jgi:plasmid stabilization system protein ParE
MGHPRPDLTRQDLLFIPVKGYDRYTIAYTTRSSPLKILRVLHGSRDVPKFFRT